LESNPETRGLTTRTWRTFAVALLIFVAGSGGGATSALADETPTGSGTDAILQSSSTPNPTAAAATVGDQGGSRGSGSGSGSDAASGSGSGTSSSSSSGEISSQGGDGGSISSGTGAGTGTISGSTGTGTISSPGGSRGQNSGNQGGGTSTGSGGSDATGQGRAPGGSGSTSGSGGQTSTGCAAPCHVIEQPVLIPPLGGTTATAPKLPGTTQGSGSTSVSTPQPSSRLPTLSSGATSRLLAGAGPASNASAATRTARAASSHVTPPPARLRTTTPALATTTAAVSGEPVAASTGSTVATTPLRTRLPGSTNTQPSVIQRFVRVVPEAVWLALAGALLLAATAGGAAVWSGARVRRQAGRFAEMSTAALTDPLTGILNRRGFTEALERELERARRYGRPLALAYVDVRGLKAVNDSAGHSAGDRLLCAAARLLQDSARTSDVVGRLGGDEMAVLLVEQTPEGALAATRRIESEVFRRRASIGLHSPWDLTVGTASFPWDGETVDDLLRAADQRLYEQRGIELRDPGGHQISAHAAQRRPTNA
jgi:diguanylate cyclase (GGDEF)-like protein